MIPSLNNSLLPSPPINSAQLLLTGGRPVLEAITLPTKLPNFTVGEWVTARVAEQLNSQQAAVLIKNALFTLNLPPGVVLDSENLRLRVASLSPTLNFSLQQEGTKEQAEQATKDGSVQVALSPASQYLNRLLLAASLSSNLELANSISKEGEATQAEGEDAQVASRALLGKSVVVDVAQQSPPKVAAELQKGVSQSGLFYESHLKDFANGRTNLTSIQQEPQARLSPLLNSAEHSTSPQLRPQLQELGNLVQRQLNGLEHQQLQFQGTAWPGQPMQLLIEQEQAEADREGNGSSELAIWSTQLSLKLPALGGMSTRIRLVGNTVQVAFAAEDELAAKLINQYAKKLEDGLASAGLALASLVVKEHE